MYHRKRVDDLGAFPVLVWIGKFYCEGKSGEIYKCG